VLGGTIVNFAKGLGIVSLAAVLGVSAAAQRAPGAPPGRYRAVAQNNAQKNPNQPNRGNRPGRRLGNLLNLPPEQREKALESDPGFKKLSPDRQAALRERLRNFNNMSPEQQKRVRDRIAFMASLTEDQRRTIRQANQQLERLPQDRQVMVHTALRHLRRMDPQEREQVLNSDRFKNTFSEEERGILTKLSAINTPEDEGNRNPPAAPGGPPK
jgi:Protein of unknown function (DUF3106)